MRRSFWLIFIFALTTALATCSDNGNGNGDPECTVATVATDCTGSLPDGCTGYWECIGEKCEPMCTKACETAADCQTEEWPTNADCAQSEGQWACENETCRAVCPTLTWTDRMEVDLERAGIQLNLQATPDGNFAIAYFKRIDEQTECTEPILGDTFTESHQDVIRYAKFDGTNWSHEDVATVSTVMLSGISMTFRGNTPLVAYLGGTPHGGSQVCGGTDLVVADGPTNWNETIVVAASNEAAAGADCPKMQSICDALGNSGDLVGIWPSIAKSKDGSTVGVVYRDCHNGYTKEADDSADMEYAFSTGGGWTKEWIDLARGSGDFSSLAFGSDGEPAVAYYNGEVGTSNGESAILFAKRPWAEWTQMVRPPCAADADCPFGQSCDDASGDCLCLTDSHCESPKRCIAERCSAVVDTVARGLSEKSISLAVGDDGRYLVAYYDVDEQNLMIAHSEDGITWSKGIVDADGNTGMYPSLVIDPRNGRPAIAYYRCGEYNPNNPTCNKNHDGPKFAYFKGDYPMDLTTQAKWKKSVVSSTGNADSNGMDGRHISAAIQSDGSIGVAYYYSWVDPSDNSTKEHLMFHKGTWE